MRLDKDTIAMLRPVVECARIELSDMEPDDVPTGLRKVAKSSARTLPPPFARSVLQELISSEKPSGIGSVPEETPMRALKHSWTIHRSASNASPPGWTRRTIEGQRATWQWQTGGSSCSPVNSRKPR